MSKLSMGALEAQVMDVLWDHDDDWMTPGAVHAVLNPARPIAYTMNRPGIRGGSIPWK